MLIDQDGHDFALNDFKDTFLIISFIYTRCPVATACPMTVHHLKAIDDLWERAQENRQAEGKRLRFLLLTLDPDYDTPKRLRAYSNQHLPGRERFILATGERTIITKILPSMFNILALPGESGTIQHNVKTILLEPGLKQIHIWKDNEFSPREVLDAILLRPTSWGDQMEHN